MFWLLDLIVGFAFVTFFATFVFVVCLGVAMLRRRMGYRRCGRWLW